MPVITRDYHRQVIETIKDLSRFNKWWSAPINLGGVPGPGGGSGIPIGGIFGQLIQTKVAYDTSELAYSGILTNVPSGSLVDNLAHMRFTDSGLAARVTILEAASGIAGIDIEEDDVLVAAGVTILNFEGDPVSVADNGGGKVTVTISGTGATAISGIFHIYNELPSGVPAASGFFYGTIHALLPDTLRVYLNGLRKGPSLFTEFAPSGFVTTFATILGDELLIDYDTSQATEGWGDEWGNLPWGS